MSFDWAGRYHQGDTPWDLGAAHPELVTRLADGDLAPSDRILVPGCGKGHDALHLATTGASVTAVDIVDALTPRVAPELERRGGSFVVGDALTFDAALPFDLLWEHTFFCALDPSQRDDYGTMAARVVRPGGRLAGIAFPANRPTTESGPPWRTTPDDLAKALGPRFRPVSSQRVAHPAPGRRWHEHWVVFERIADNERARS